MRINRFAMLARGASTENGSAGNVAATPARLIPSTDKARKDPNMQDIGVKYFTPENLAAGGAYLAEAQALVTQDKGNLHVNFDPTKPAPENFALLVAPISERQPGNLGNKVVGAIACLVPTVEAIGAFGEEGVQYIRDCVLSAMRTKIANAVRPGKDGEPSGAIPQTVEDFIRSQREGGFMKAFNEKAPLAVKALKSMGFAFMTPALLKQILISKAFAESQFPKVPQDRWVAILDLLIGHATKDGMDVSVLQNWKATRDQAAASDVSDIDLDKLGELLDAKDDAPAAEAPKTAEASTTTGATA